MYPLPLKEDVLDSLGDAEVFPALDFMDGSC